MSTKASMAESTVSRGTSRISSPNTALISSTTTWTSNVGSGGKKDRLPSGTTGVLGTLVSVLSVSRFVYRDPCSLLIQASSVRLQRGACRRSSILHRREAIPRPKVAIQVGSTKGRRKEMVERRSAVAVVTCSICIAYESSRSIYLG